MQHTFFQDLSSPSARLKNAQAPWPRPPPTPSSSVSGATRPSHLAPMNPTHADATQSGIDLKLASLLQQRLSCCHVEIALHCNCDACICM